ncbi:SusD/RagB family nutrient-binding outer membrane lipoprotein [Maribacter sp. M208]|uniref:SusD/RagB family nutrient-binding outer membrane lipoprotein n=1 Tax=Maribacter huludaoensis TaxID=3030010 RepID=UPI0023EB1584|nr:SusD/RagB family nutrient-binding outer membrane lipoprotein [Maribacter huludaoensis]MDF4221396.1 SusD/RagB family nutrient-binding outer membrane lipoprotein [Maribacter huludaoensis]
MKKINHKSLLKIFATGLLLLGTACETIELDLLDDPNAISLSQADLNFFLNSNQVTLAEFFEGTSASGGNGGMSNPGMEVTRLGHMNGLVYQNSYTANEFNFEWEQVYSTIISNNRALEPLAIEQEAFQHLGIAQIIEAYAVTTLVDFMGDIPYSEAVAGVSNPSRDPGDQTYGAMLDLLDEAIANLNATSAVTYTSDLFYGGDSDKWIKLANTLKLKLYLQSRLLSSGDSEFVNSTISTSGINAIIASGDYISSPADDFQFNWSSTDNNPDSRHPSFAGEFDSPGIIGDYMSNHLMNELNAGVNDKTVVDPRLRYYFYRQLDRNAENTVEQDCFGALPPAHYGFSIPFCTTDFPGYWGRDHGDNSGIPPDTGSRATFGVYPVGGVFDDSSFEPIVSRSIGTQGQGISPIMLSSYVNFMLAESALTLNTTGDALTYLTQGITQSINKVIAFGADQAAGSGFEPTETEISDYIDQITTNYMNATSDAERMNIIGTEYHIALYGNGVEAYNTYRRTGTPNDLQPIRAGAVDNFIRSFFYPTVSVSNNSNSDQKDNVTEQVFWDTNPATGFIN